MGSDPKKPFIDQDEDEGSTAMFSREAHGWFSSVADAEESDTESVADLARNAVVESSPLSRVGGVTTAGMNAGANQVGSTGRGGAQPAAPRTAKPVSSPGASLPNPHRSVSDAPIASGSSPGRLPTGGSLARLSGRQVILAAFVGGALLAAVIGVAVLFLLTRH